MYVSLTEKFFCKNGKFCYSNGFNKKAINIEDVSLVEIIIRQNNQQSRFRAKVIFYNRNNEKVMTIFEYYDKLAQNEFKKKKHLINSLSYYNIPYTLTVKEYSI